MAHFSILDSEEAKNIAVVHKTNQGYSGKDLWKLKQERPELFGGAAAPAQSGKPAPPGFEQLREMPGWLYHRDKALYFQRESGLLYCRDSNNELYELHQGEDYGGTLTVRGDAATVSAKGQASRNVIINDLHRAAASMKLDFSHHDSPAAMFAVYDASAGRGEHAEAAAKGLHMQLLPRLAAWRGRWQNDRLQGVLAESIAQLRQEIAPERGVALAVALLLGGRLTMAATGGAICMIFGQVGQSDGNVDNLEVLGPENEDAEAMTHCAVLEDSHLGALLTVKGVRTSGLPSARMRALARSHVMADRPRAGCVALLEEARKVGGEPPLVAAAVRFNWSGSRGQDPGKRLKTDTPPNGLTKVRCRHLLLRYAGCQALLGDRRKKPTRTVGDAETQMLHILPQIANGGPAAFTAKCKEISECDTAMKSGDLAGDLGWLDRDPAKNRKVPAAVVRAAFFLAVGQVSDLVSSERGIHLILRTA
ncbi:PIN1 [Symbiodinium microadriaticum]|nr:PIN1 [Symbiodinium microadriaticum]